MGRRVKKESISLCATHDQNLALIGWLQHAGLALAIGLAACLNALLLYRGLRRHDIYTPQAGWRSFCGKLLIALTAMGGVLWFASRTATDWLHWGLTERLWRLMIIVTAGASTYFATLALTGFRLRDFKRKAAT